GHGHALRPRCRRTADLVVAEGVRAHGLLREVADADLGPVDRLLRDRDDYFARDDDAGLELDVDDLALARGESYLLSRGNLVDRDHPQEDQARIQRATPVATRDVGDAFEQRLAGLSQRDDPRPRDRRTIARAGHDAFDRRADVHHDAHVVAGSYVAEHGGREVLGTGAQF